MRNTTVIERILAAFMFGGLLLAPSLAFGVTGTSDSATTSSVKPTRTASTSPVQNFKSKLEEQRQNVEAKRAQLASTTDARKAQLASTTDALRAKAASTSDARLQKFREEAQKRIQAFAERAAERLQAAIDRFEKLVERIESRIEKLEDEGGDMTDAKDALDRTVAQIAEAQAAVDALKNSLAVALNTATVSDAFNQSVRDDFRRVHELIRAAVAEIREAHRALMDVIPLLKRELPRNATTTSDRI